MFATRFRGPHSGGDTLADQRRFQFGHGADDGEHRPAHGTFGIDLILYAYEAHAQMVEFLERSQQVARASCEAVPLPLNPQPLPFELAL
jgi:hypothetical protein